MAIQGPETYNIVAFDAVVQHEFQQMTSKLYPFVKVEVLNAAQQTIDGLGSIEMKEANGRYQPIVFDTINHTRRGVGRKEFAVDLPIDEKDVRVTLANQSTEYAKAIVAAAQRQVDRIISEALFAPVQMWQTDSNGVSVPTGTPLTFANDGGQTIDASAGLTYATFVDARRRFVNNDVDLETERLIFCGTGDEMAKLMQDDKFIDADYTNQRVVDGGVLTSANGIECKWFAADATKPVIKVNSSGDRECAIFVANGITLAINKEITITVKDRPDLRNTKQISAVLSMGAVRNKPGVVYKIETTPTA